VCSSDALAITPQYHCSSVGPGCPSYLIDVASVGLHQAFESSIEMPLDVIDECAEVCITSLCDGVACAQCCFTLCCEGPVDCGCRGWSGAKIRLVSPAVGWEQPLYQCGSEIDLPAEVCRTGELDVIPQYWCIPPDPETCPDWYMIEVGAWGLQESFGESYSLPLEPLLGCAEVCVTAYCGEQPCEECCFTLCCEDVAVCDCGQWSGDMMVLSTVGGWHGGISGCGQRVDLPPEACASETLTIQPFYRCNPPDPETCPIWYAIDVPAWGVQDSFGGSYELPLEPLQGCADVCITPFCGEQPCGQCCFTLCCQSTTGVTEQEWLFETLVRGGLVMMQREMPMDLQRELSSAGAVDDERVSSTLPALASFALDIEDVRGTLTGVIPGEPATYELAYELYDRSRSLVGVLHVLIKVEGEGGGHTRCTAPINLNTGVAEWTVVYPNGPGPVPAQPMLPNGNWVDSPDLNAVWIDHAGTLAGSGWVSDPIGMYEYQTSFDFNPDSCCGNCVLMLQYAADDHVQFFLDTPRTTYDLCKLNAGCCALREDAYRKLGTCTVDLCSLEGGAGTYKLRARVENEATVTGLLVIGGVRCR